MYIFKVSFVPGISSLVSHWTCAEVNLFKRTKDENSPTGVYLADKLKADPWWMDVVPNVRTIPYCCNSVVTEHQILV